MQDQRGAQERDFISFAASASPRTVKRDQRTLTVSSANHHGSSFAMSSSDRSLRLIETPPGDVRGDVLAALEAAFAWFPEAEAFTVDLGDRPDAVQDLVARGALAIENGAPVSRAAMLMQQAEIWLAKGVQPVYPTRHVVTGDRRHPLRPSKPAGVLYARFIPWLGQTLTFRAATVEDDLQTFHRWMNDDRVAVFWNESGDLDAHRRYVERLISDPHMVPMIGALDGAPFAWFEIYWAKENRLAPFYDADDYDRGWHVAVGEERRRGGAYIGAWLPSLLHFMFLDDPRTRRIVGEPATAHRQQIRNLERSGFAQVKSFDFPHKRATLVSLLRERFFDERLWLPATVGVAASDTMTATAAPLRGVA